MPSGKKSLGNPLIPCSWMRLGNFSMAFLDTMFGKFENYVFSSSNSFHALKGVFWANLLLPYRDYCAFPFHYVYSACYLRDLFNWSLTNTWLWNNINLGFSTWSQLTVYCDVRKFPPFLKFSFNLAINWTSLHLKSRDRSLFEDMIEGFAFLDPRIPSP